MREYGQVQCGYWTHPDIRRLSSEARELGLYLIAGPHSNGIGCYWLHDGYIAADLGHPMERVPELFSELSEIGLADRCEETGFVIVRGFLKWNSISNPNVASAREKEFLVIPKNFKYRADLAGSLLAYPKHFTNEFKTLLATVTGTVPGRTPPHPTPPDPTPPHPTRAPARGGSAQSAGKGGVNGHGSGNGSRRFKAPKWSDYPDHLVLDAAKELGVATRGVPSNLLLPTLAVAFRGADKPTQDRIWKSLGDHAA